MSPTALIVPRTVPVTLRPPGAFAVLYGHRADAPAGGRRPQHHLERSSRPAVAEPHGQQGGTPSGPHGAQVGHRDLRALAHLGGQRTVGVASGPRPRAAARNSGPDHEVGVAPLDDGGDERAGRAG